MKKARILLFTFVTALVVSCGTTRTVPITGRKQNLLVSDEQVLSLSSQEYTKYMSTAKKSTDANKTAMVKRVGKRLATAVEAFLTNNGMADETKNYSWEFNLVSDKEANAFCMPGGKIVVYEGLLPFTKDDQSLAIVLGHEIAHAVARHSAEQMSTQIRNNMGIQVLGGALGAFGVGSSTTQIAQIIAQQGLQFRSLHYSRDNELEADKMGLIFAAMAGYDPRVAIPFWKGMASANGNQSDVLSDHPSDAKRIALLEKEMPEVLKYYQGGKTSSTAVPTTSKSLSTKKTISASGQNKTVKK
ncbi:MAG: M48 family metallopeptidase [Prevotella sp.]